jgi:hypothetical protein
MFLGSIFVMSERKIGKGSDEKDVWNSFSPFESRIKVEKIISGLTMG